MNLPSRWKANSILVILLLILGLCGMQVSSSAPRAAAICDSVSQIPVAECQALVDFYDRTGGAYWTRNDGWLATSTPCSWYGVNCYGGHVYRLILYYNGLSGSLPASLGNLSRLRNLVLHNNAICGGIPDTFGNFLGLEELALNNNRLTGSIPESLGSLPILRQVYLYDNLLSGDLPASLGSLPCLRGLYLHGNALSGSIPASLGSVASLEELDLADNQLRGSIPDSLGGLARLEALLLSGNQLAGGIPGSLAGLTNLRVLTLDRNPLSGAIPAGLKNLPLTYFYFNDTNLCEPLEVGFQMWLADVPYLQRTGIFCGNPAFQYRMRLPFVAKMRLAH